MFCLFVCIYLYIQFKKGMRWNVIRNDAHCNGNATRDVSPTFERAVSSRILSAVHVLMQDVVEALDLLVEKRQISRASPKMMSVVIEMRGILRVKEPGKLLKLVSTRGSAAAKPELSPYVACIWLAWASPAAGSSLSSWAPTASSLGSTASSVGYSSSVGFSALGSGSCRSCSRPRCLSLLVRINVPRGACCVTSWCPPIASILVRISAPRGSCWLFCLMVVLARINLLFWSSALPLLPISKEPRPWVSTA